MSIPRPVQYMNYVMRQFPYMAKQVDFYRAERGKKFPLWPNWCFMPVSLWLDMIITQYDPTKMRSPRTGDTPLLSAVGTWRYSQGIYKVDPDLMEGLVGTSIAGKLPSEVFLRLPEWCVYVETPGLTWTDGQPLFGFWAHLQWDAETERIVLHFLLDCTGSLRIFAIYLGNCTVLEAVNKSIVLGTNKYWSRLGHEAFKASDKFIIDWEMEEAREREYPIPQFTPEEIKQTAQHLSPLISILLYLCSEEPEIDDLKQPGLSPSYPKPEKTKKGMRFFPPDKPRIWSVGTQIGAQLRTAILSDSKQKETGIPSGRSVRAHIRRGHWHGYWLGPRSGERRFVYRWISPLLVGGYEE